MNYERAYACAHMHVHCNVKSRDLFLKFKFKTYPAMAACSCTNGRGVNKYSWTILIYHLIVTTQTSEKMDQDLYRKFIESNHEQ